MRNKYTLELLESPFMGSMLSLKRLFYDVLENNVGVPVYPSTEFPDSASPQRFACGSSSPAGKLPHSGGQVDVEVYELWKLDLLTT